MPQSILILFAVILVVTSETDTITAKIGSDLRLPVPKSVSSSDFWDLYAGDHHMANYHNGFRALNGYEGRLKFSSDPDIVILTKWTRADGLDFRFAIKGLNGISQLMPYVVNYKVSVDESVHGDTRNNVDHVSSSSICLTVFAIFSLPSVLSALVIGIFCFNGVYI
ncbi:uncharacterized protein LOC143975615 [Lithobates pipiens]